MCVFALIIEANKRILTSFSKHNSITFQSQEFFTIIHKQLCLFIAIASNTICFDIEDIIELCFSAKNA